MRRFNANKLRELMRAAKVTGRALADRVGVTNVTVSRILNAHQQPSRGLAVRLAQEFSLPVDELYRPGPVIRPGGFDGKALAARRRMAGLTQGDLAQRVDADLAMIQDIESGRRRPTDPLVRQCARALDVSQEQLLWRESPDFEGWRLRAARETRGIAPGELAGSLGVETERLLLWEADEEKPSAGEAQRVEQLLGVTPGTLHRAPAGEDPAGIHASFGGAAVLWAETTASRAEILARIEQFLSALSPGNCLQVLAYIQGLAAQAPPRAPAAPPARASASGPDTLTPGFVVVSEHEIPEGLDWRPRYVPVIDNIAAGPGAEVTQAEEYPPGWAESFVAFHDAPEGAFAVRVAGSSMAPSYRDGDMLVIDPNRPAASGEICVVVYTRLKRVRFENGTVVLESLNPSFTPVTLQRTAVAQAYAILAHLPKVIPAGQDEESATTTDLAGVRAIADRTQSRQDRDEGQTPSRRTGG